MLPYVRILSRNLSRDLIPEPNDEDKYCIILSREINVYNEIAAPYK